MLNKDGERELAYIARVTEIVPIQGSDNCECAMVGGWHAMVRKNTFQVGDLCVCFEYDSLLDCENPAFAFMANRKWKVKPQKFTFGGKGNFTSDSLVMTISDFGWKVENDTIVIEPKTRNEQSIVLKEGTGVTELLKIKYWEVEDNQRKAPVVDKYKKMAQRHGKLFSKPLFRWLMRREWGKKLLFIFYGKKKDNGSSFPSWVVKTDEERCQNMPWIFNEEPKKEYIGTEKVDGTSTTFTMKGTPKKYDYRVCSRNVCFDKPDKNCFYDTNVYLEMAEKYHMEDTLKRMLKDKQSEDKNIAFVTIQGETYGGNIQKRTYNMINHDLKIFNVIFGYKDGTTVRLNPIEGTEFCKIYGLPFVDIVVEHYILPATCDELLAYAHGASKIDGELREGIVFRSYDGVTSFKAVDNEFLIKYHNS